MRSKSSNKKEKSKKINRKIQKNESKELHIMKTSLLQNQEKMIIQLIPMKIQKK